jgi:hypothetical protein
MSAFGREAVYAALFSFIQSALTGSPTPAVTVSRSAQHYSNVDPQSQMPAVFQLQKGEVAVRKRGLDEKVTLSAVLLIYTAASQDGEVAASTAINNIIDTIDNALSTGLAPENNQNLGLPEVVQHAWIEGKTEIYEGILLNVSIAIVPIHILCTG